MKKNLSRVLLTVTLTSIACFSQAKEWTLEECIRYALQNNITLQKNRLTQKSAMEDVLQSKSALFPSLDASTTQSVSYRPWQESGAATVTNGYVQSSVDKISYGGTYGITANWTVWNGNRNHNQVKLNNNLMRQAEANAEITATTIQEQIAQLYVQILYSQDAIKVNKQSLETSVKNEERGKEMMNVGKMSKADLAQLTAQRAQDEYNIVASQSTLEDYKRQLKQLLQITDSEPFDVVTPTTTDDMALQEIPTVNSVYTSALDSRPEMKYAQLVLEGSDLSIKLAKAQNLPTIGLTGSVATNTSSLSSTTWGTQLKTNFDMGAGITVNIPIFDNRTKKTALNKALINKQSYMLDLRDKQTTLYSNIENYWLQATSNQNKFKAAQTSVKSETESYELLSEQFRLGLKNIVELMTGKTNLVTAQQNELQSKYLTILNINLLKFYQTGELK